MPIHDWTRVPAGTWHDFHLSWIAEIRLALNNGILPSDYYAQAEQIAGPFGPNVLTLQIPGAPASAPLASTTGTSGLAVSARPPRMRLNAATETDDYALKRRTLVIRHTSGDNIVALLEILSPGNKASRHALHSFVDKAVEILHYGYHLLLVDLFPPGRLTPRAFTEPSGRKSAMSPSSCHRESL